MNNRWKLNLYTEQSASLNIHLTYIFICTNIQSISLTIALTTPAVTRYPCTCRLPVWESCNAQGNDRESPYTMLQKRKWLENKNIYISFLILPNECHCLKFYVTAWETTFFNEQINVTFLYPRNFKYFIVMQMNII